MSKPLSGEIFKHKISTLPTMVVSWTSRYLTKGTRKSITNLKYINFKKRLKKLNNFAVMFVRAPKHFKSGKQHIYSFCGNLRLTRYYKNLNTEFLFSGNSKVLYNNLSKFMPLFSPDIQLSRITIKIEVCLNFTEEQKYVFINPFGPAPDTNEEVNLFEYMQRLDAMGRRVFNIIANWFIAHKKSIISNYHNGRYPLEDIEGIYPLEIEEYYAEFVIDSFKYLTLKDFKKLVYWLRNKKKFFIEEAAAARREINFYKYLDEENGGKVNKIIVKTKDPYKKSIYKTDLEERVQYLQEMERREAIRESVFANNSTIEESENSYIYDNSEFDSSSDEDEKN